MCVFKDGREFEGIAVLTINDKFYGLAIINEFINVSLDSFTRVSHF